MSEVTGASAPFKREPRPGQKARCGVAAVPFLLPDGLAMAGYSLMGKAGRRAAWELCARAMVLEDDAGHGVAFVTADLMSASRYLHERAAALTRQGASGLDVHQIVLMGTHTHTAPGGFYGNSLYDTIAQSAPGFQRRLADDLARAIADAIEEAWRTARPASISLQTEVLWGVSRNRSLAPFRENPEAMYWNTDPAFPGYRPGGGALSAEQLAVDPRVVILSAYDDEGRRIGTFATFGCHNTALGMDQKYYAPDWTGIAASLVEQDARYGAPITLIGLSGAGDASPTPPGDDASHHEGPKKQGVDLARFVGARVARTILAAHARPPRLVPITLKSWYEDWVPRAGSNVTGVPATRLAKWELGAPALAGAEDGRSFLYPGLVREGMRGGTFSPVSPQFPKVPALGVVGSLLKNLAGLSPSPGHALHVVQVADHVFATVPGEPTACAAFQLESAMLRLPGVATASVLGYAGDYAGYFTTRPEFLLQHYEGASTLYGAESVNHLAARLARLARGAPFAARGREAAVLEGEVRAMRAPAPVASGEAIASGGHRDGRGVFAWWAWPAAHAPEDALQVQLELRASGQPEEVYRLAPVEVRLLDEPLLGEERRVWQARFELDVPLEGLSIVAVPRPPAPFQAPDVVIERAPELEAAPAEPRVVLELSPFAAASAVAPTLGEARSRARVMPPVETEDEGVAPMGPAEVEELVREAERDPVGVGRILYARIDAGAAPTDEEAAELARKTVSELRARAVTPEGALVLEAVAPPVMRAAPPVRLPEDFTFEGYDPEAIPIDPADTRFETKADWLSYVVFTGGLYHTRLLKLDPVRRNGAFNSRFTYPLASPTAQAPVEVALFSDFGNGLAHARYIARQLIGHPYAIHLGDVYYAGRRKEFEEYFAGPLEPLLADTELFMLAGNHEMYSRGTTFHAYLDKKRARYPERQKQEGASFRLVSDRFQIVGMDTAWWKYGRVDPEVLELVRGWLREGRGERMNILLTSEHGWDFGGNKATELLSEDLRGIADAGLVDLWFWGNVHHAALYEPSRWGPFVASCIGHAGYPYYTLNPADAPKSAAPVRWAEYEHRFSGWKAAGGGPLREDMGNNGWCKLRLLHDGTAELVYIDWRGRERHRARVARTPRGVSLT